MLKTSAAIVKKAKAPFEIVEIELPDPGPHEVLVRIVGVGICHTDLASRDGLLGAPFPSIFGHEGSGVVEKVGSQVTKLESGDHVVLSPNSDGTCRHCQRGFPMYCDHYPDLNFQTDPEGPRASVLDGGHAYLKYFGQSSFAGYALASDRNAIKVTKDVPLKILGPLGCGVQTGAGTVMNGLRPHSGSTMVVLGTGAVGLSAIMGALICGCSDIVAVSRTTERLEFARTLGATDTINTNEETDLAAAIRARLPAGADYIVDAAGAPALMGPAIGGLGKLGTLALVAVPPTVDRAIEVPWFPTLLQGQSVSGFVEGNSIPDVFIPQMIELYRLGRFPFDRLLEFYPFDKINEAVDDQIAGKVIKAVLELGTG